MDRVRRAVVGLASDGNKRITHQMIYECLGAATTAETDRIRRHTCELVRRGELRRLEAGAFRYDPDNAPRRRGESYIRVWRAMRASKQGWSWTDISQVTRVSYTVVLRYCRWLARVGYVAQVGRRGNTKLWRTTRKGREQRETPFPPTISDPFETERAAACRIVRAMMETDPNRVKDKIASDCKLLLRRFAPAEKGEDQ